MPAELFELLEDFAKSKNFGTVGSLSVALVVTEFAKEMGLPLNASTLITPSGTQVRRLGKELVQSILGRYGVVGILAAEGGRTSRGSVANMREYVNFLNSLSQQGMIDLEAIEAYWVEQAHLLIDARQSDSRLVSYSAVPLEQNEQRFYFTTIPVSSLFPYCFVARRNEDPRTGFQRRLNQSRAEDIAKYLHEGRGSIPTNIVLSAQPGAAVEYNGRSKIISYQRMQGAFLVLDGQHRLWGYEICRQKYGADMRIPVSIYIGLTRAEEARLFIDINTTQIGVPSALLLDIKQIAEIESSSEQVLRGIFDDLNSDKESPMRNMLSPSKSVTGKISRVTFNKAMMPVIRANVWSNTSRKSQYQLLINYLRAIDKVVEDKNILSRAAFFESVCEVFDDVVQTSIAKNNNAKEDSLSDVLEPLSSIDFAHIAERSRPTKATYTEAIKNALKKSVSISDSMV
jgi:DGQHR domain-containing protein